mgnify:CR=1 FL=1
MGARRIEKRYAKVNLRSQKSDFGYWQAQPYPVRLAALEEIRQEYHRWRYGAEPRELQSLNDNQVWCMRTHHDRVT